MALYLVLIFTLLAASALAYQLFARVREQEHRNASFARAKSAASVESATAMAGDVAANIAGMGGNDVLAGALDVGRVRESTRRRRLWHVFWLLFPLAAFMYYRIGDGNMLRPGLPELNEQQLQIFLPLGLIF